MKQDYSTLGAGDLKSAVQLPPDEDLNSWLAVNVVDCFNELNLIYGTVQDACTDITCPCMTAGTFSYLWQDNVKYTQPTEVSAQMYVELLLTFAESQINDEAIFPLHGTDFPRDFKKRVSTIFRRFLRVYGHIYHHHLDQITEIGALSHLNTVFKHFYFFCTEFGLIPPGEYAPLQDVIDAMTKQ